MKTRARLLAALLVVSAFLAGTSGPADAQSLQVSPISVDFAPGQRATTLSVTNKGDTRTALQVRPFAWGQPLGEDVLLPTADLAASPPMAEIEPGETQTFRLVLRTAPQSQEASYRLLLDQLPAAASPGTVRVALRISVPVFAKSNARADRKLSWKVVVAQGSASLVAENNGGEHVRVINPILTEAGGRRLELKGPPNPYILPGMRRSWGIVAGNGLQTGSTVHLTAMSNEGTVDALVPVSRP